MWGVPHDLLLGKETYYHCTTPASRSILLTESAETQNRTVDTAIFSRVLYQLSYLGQIFCCYTVPPEDPNLRVNYGLQTHLKILVACALSGKRAEFYLVIEGLSSKHLPLFLDFVSV